MFHVEHFGQLYTWHTALLLLPWLAVTGWLAICGSVVLCKYIKKQESGRSRNVLVYDAGFMTLFENIHILDQCRVNLASRIGFDSIAVRRKVVSIEAKHLLFPSGAALYDAVQGSVVNDALSRFLILPWPWRVRGVGDLVRDNVGRTVP